jgi:hypothetical protein
MPTKKHTITCNQIKQLIDLNGDLTNFELTFKASSQGNEPFDALVVDQATLDGDQELPYKKADTGSISGSITADKNMYQNYFLILKSDKPCQIVCDIDIKEIPPAPVQALQAPQAHRAPQGREIERPMIKEDYTPLISSFPGLKPWMIVAIVIVVVGLIYLLFWKKTGSVSSSNTEPSYATAFKPSAPAAPRPSLHSSLLARLNSLPNE